MVVKTQPRPRNWLNIEKAKCCSNFMALKCLGFEREIHNYTNRGALN